MLGPQPKLSQRWTGSLEGKGRSLGGFSLRAGPKVILQSGANYEGGQIGLGNRVHPLPKKNSEGLWVYHFGIAPVRRKGKEECLAALPEPSKEGSGIGAENERYWADCQISMETPCSVQKERDEIATSCAEGYSLGMNIYSQE